MEGSMHGWVDGCVLAWNDWSCCGYMNCLMDGSIDEWMEGWTDEEVDEWVSGWIDE
jgi:hypothetical protein